MAGVEGEERTDPSKEWDFLLPASRNLGSLSYLTRHTLTFSEPLRSSSHLITQPRATREQKGHLCHLEGPVARDRQLLAPPQAARSCLDGAQGLKVWWVGSKPAGSGANPVFRL